MTTHPRLQELLTASDHVIEFINRETDYLKKMQIASFSSMQDEKFALLHQYENLTLMLETQIKKGSVILAPEDQELLSQKMAMVREVMAFNERALRAMNDFNNRLIKEIISSLQEQDEPVGYTQNGTKRATPRQRSLKQSQKPV
jgi:hypothetical protein